MPVIRVFPSGMDMRFEAGRHSDLLDLLTANGVIIDSECGGKGSCGKCLVELLSGALLDRDGAPAEPERGDMYLACRGVPAGDCEIRVIGRPGDSSILDGLIAGSIGVVAGGAGPADRLGLAVDVGTTTVVALLADLDTRAPVAVRSETNPQRAFGADVVSRIAYSCETAGGRRGTDVLQETVVCCINRLVKALCDESGQDARRIERVVCAGNTAMQHFLVGITPEHLGMYPYEAEFKEIEPGPARSVGLELEPGAVLQVLPNIHSYVGADTVGCLLSIERRAIGACTLMIDMGTNTEMVLGADRKRVTCSAAAGPAFEGAHLEHGMRATAGAISSVWTDRHGNFEYRTVGAAPPLGICGSGIVDAVATMRRQGIVEECGRMPDRAQCVIVPAGESGTGHDITVTRNDVREIQLVKASIATGIGFLLEETGSSIEQLERIYVAGAFGNYLDIANARFIGLLPDIASERFEAVGDAALKGAYMVLTGGAEALERVHAIAYGTDHLELATRSGFQRRFLDNLDLEAYR